MLTERVKGISAEIEKIKDELRAAIQAKLPAEPKRFSVVMFSQLDRSILSAEHYNTPYQLNRLLNYLSNPNISLESVVKCFKSIVDTGKAPAFDKLIFNAEARKVVSELL